MATESATLPPDLFDTTTILSLIFTVLIVVAAYLTSLAALPPASFSRNINAPSTTTAAVRFLFIWHFADALCHFILEGSFLYHCFFSWVPAGSPEAEGLVPSAYNYLGWGDERVYGPQAGDGSPFASLWMVYARADRRWAGADIGVISLELLTVFVDGFLALYICYGLAKKNPMVNVWMIILATCELYGGFMTFCPEWLTGNINLDGSNFMYLWVYLVFFNMLWVFIPLYALYYSFQQIARAFKAVDTRKQL